MDEGELRHRLAAAPVGRLATVTPEGRPHVVPCCFALCADTVYTAVDAKPKTTVQLQRLANIAAHPAAALLVDRYDDDWSQLWWVRADGFARVVEDGDERAAALTALVAKYRQYRDQPPGGPTIAIDVTRWSGWTFRR